MVKSHIWPRMGREFCARHKSSFLLLSQDCLQAQARVRLLHRSRRTHRVPLRVQQDCEVTALTLKHRETEAILQTQKPKLKGGQHSSNEKSIARSPRGLRSSQTISKIQKCQHSQTLLLRTGDAVLRAEILGLDNSRSQSSQ